jgi:Ca2+-binding RTX toxin-like protein
MYKLKLYASVEVCKVVVWRRRIYMATVRLDVVSIGRVGDTNIYRVDLGQSGFSSVSAITIRDDNVLSGGSGSASGLDLDYVRVLNTATADPAQVAGTAGEPVFDFGPGGVVFQAGFQTPVGPNDPPEWNTNLLGTSGANVYDPSKATLGIADQNELCLGEGGQVTFLFNTGLSTSGRYFYFADSGGADLGSVLVSDQATVAPRSFTLEGTAGKDTIRIGVGQNEHLKFTDTTVYGRRGDDKIFGSFGNDALLGESGKDYVSGGAGRDIVNGGLHNDRLSGGADSDAFVFDSKLGTSKTDRKVNFDKITDFDVRLDSFWLDNKIFKKLGSGTLSDPGDLNREFFVTGSKARERDDYLIYNRKTGVLSYDSDGSGSKAAVEFAQLSKGLKLTYNDFSVI